MKNIACALVVLSGLATAAHGAETHLVRLQGSHTVGSKLIPELAQQWLKNQGYTAQTTQFPSPSERRIIARNDSGATTIVEIRTQGSNAAFADLYAGKTDIGMASRPIKPDEAKQLSTLGPMESTRSEFIVALDGLTIIAHPSNGLTNIDKDTLRQIYTGRITDWRTLGQKPNKIHVYARDAGSGTFDTFSSLILNNSKIVASAQRFESSNKLIEAVANDPLAIGFVGLSFSGNAKRLAIFDDGTKPMLPSSFNVATEDYALSRRLYLYIPEQSTNRLARAFADYTISPEAQHLVESLGFISQSVTASAQAAPADAPDEYKKLTTNAQRLSLNIRFRPGSAKLDNKAARDVSRLVDYMARPENRQRKLMVFGFADARETSTYLSLSFSVNRADAVADYLINSGLEPDKVRGYGQDLPIANNNNERNRNLNRRVEVWVR